MQDLYVWEICYDDIPHLQLLIFWLNTQETFPRHPGSNTQAEYPMLAVVLRIQAPCFSDAFGLLPGSSHIICIGMYLRDQRSFHHLERQPSRASVNAWSFSVRRL